MQVFAIIAGFAMIATSAFAERHESDKLAMLETDGVLHQGVWSDKEYSAAGTWSVYKEDGQTFVELSDDFRTRNAPDLKIFLSPMAATDLTSQNATNASFLVAKLASNKGSQTYEIPAGVNLADYRSILIHCERFSKLWTAAPLS